MLCQQFIAKPPLTLSTDGKFHKALTCGCDYIFYHDVNGMRCPQPIWWLKMSQVIDKINKYNEDYRDRMIVSFLMYVLEGNRQRNN